MDSIKKFWSETMEIPGAGWIVGISGLVIFVLISYYILSLIRNMALGKTEDPASYISEFQRLRNEGKLDDEEYERLAKVIPKDVSPQVGDQSKGSD